MDLIKQSFSVNFSYNVYFSEDIFHKNNLILKNFFEEYNSRGTKQKILFVIDDGVVNGHPQLIEKINSYFSTYSETIELVDPIIILPGGEEVKNRSNALDEVLDAINTYGIDRHSYVAGIGGGALLDMVGYASAISHRGIRHLRFPTTVLSQNDSGVGVKNGINYFNKKNFLGTFAPPIGVFNDPVFLRSLEERDWRSGIAEAVKVALIKDLAFFEWLENNADRLRQQDEEAMKYLIFRCAQMHCDHIAGGDPFETGSARPLDFGHWAAHKLEHITHYEVRHGEAVAIGIALDSTYSHYTGMISRDDLQRIISVFTRVGLNVFHEKLEEGRTLQRGLDEFREHLGGQLTITLLEHLGKGMEVHEMDYDRIEKSIQFLKRYSTQKV